MASNASKTIAALQQIDAKSFTSDEERVIAAKTLQDLLGRIQRPVDQWFQMTWMNPAYIAALKVAVDVELFPKWVAHGSSPKTAAELSRLCGVEEALLTRLLRHMVAMNGLMQPQAGTYSMTSLTNSLSDNSFKNNVDMMFSEMYPGFLNLPSFLAKNGYKEPTDPSHSSWQDLRQKPETYIEWFSTNPTAFQRFHNVMVAYNSATPEWVDAYPTQKLVESLKPGRAVIVDIGGSKGGDLKAFQKRHPGLPDGSLYLEDLPQVIESLQGLSGITPLVQSAFEPQQIKGARVYFMHFLLHGFNDEQSLAVLKNTAAAMEPGYSKLLLHEHVIDEEHPKASGTAMDLTMMHTLSANERTKTRWTKLVEDAGLKLAKVYSISTLNESIIEAELA